MTSNSLKYLGKGVKLHEYTKIIRPDVVEIGDGSQIDDFVLLNGGVGITLGRQNHFASFVAVIGGGRLTTGDYVGIATGAKLITGTHHYGDGQRISPLIPEEDQCVLRGVIRLEQDVFIGANSTIFPDVTIGEGAIVGAGALVKNDLEPWSINVGVPCKRIGTRPPILKK